MPMISSSSSLLMRQGCQGFGRGVLMMIVSAVLLHLRAA